MKKKRNQGRPTKFKVEYTDLMIKFFDIEPFKKVTMETSTESFKDGGTRKKSAKYKLLPNRMPTLYRFSRKIGVEYSTVWRWSDETHIAELQMKIDQAISKGSATADMMNELIERKRFCNAYKEAKELQKDFLITIGLAGAAPAQFAIFTAKNVTDMRDSSVVTHNIPKPISDVLLDAKKTEEVKVETE